MPSKAIPGFIDRWLARLSAGWTFAGPIVPGTIGALVTGFLSDGVAWISRHGAFGWWCAALAGGALAEGLYLLYAMARKRIAEAKVIDRWSLQAHQVNPLDNQFNRQRINIADLAHPVSKRIVGKTFTDCEIFGPANVAMEKTTITKAAFHCEFVIGRDDAGMANVYIFEDCHIIGGGIFMAVLFVNQAFFNKLKADMPQIESISYAKP